ncbi:hypothetical protein H9Q72_008941 [Fusarium xylarioides]|uniref:Uncharacterized protein n=1 Tax=Fusarium xylarioides TaxID=221167 RepID=A0A9P7HNP1_9HYPO|nr:hypothetical protein H9Q70_005463 [Fusarium xylarioides]KAG5762949.1 hypothetical protein H9Q72_008941 [Fusarium xylarioides]KAG5784170.1 hypothetical protein H9Q73_002156 [Fusarium xylarioides]
MEMEVRSLYSISILLLTTSLARPTLVDNVTTTEKKNKQNLTFSLFSSFFGPFTDSHIIHRLHGFPLATARTRPLHARVETVKTQWLDVVDVSKCRS